MSPSRQRIEIARLCGWKEIFDKKQPLKIFQFRMYTEDDAWTTVDWPMPDYINSLDAMAAVEQLLLTTDDLKRHYVDNLLNANNGGNGSMRLHGRWALATATAVQKVEVILKMFDVFK